VGWELTLEGEMLAAVGATRWFWPDATAEICCWGGAWWVCTAAEWGWIYSTGLLTSSDAFCKKKDAETW